MTGRKFVVVAASVATLMSAAVVTAPLADAKPKVKPPAKVAKARVASVSTSAASLTWKNPKSKNFKATVVRIAVGKKAPKTIKSGRAVAKVSKKKHAVRVVRLKANTLYTVSIFSSGGGKIASKPVVVRVRTRRAPSPAPTKDTAAPGAVSNLVVAVVDGAAKLSWTPPSDKDFNGVKIFRTESAKELVAKRSVAAASETKQIADLPAGRNSFDDTTIEAAKSYTYSVLSKDATGNTSAPATPASPAVTASPTDPVTDVEAFDDDNGGIEVDWTRPEDESHYAGAKVVRKEGASAPTSVADGKTVENADASEDYYFDDDVTTGKTYSYTVFAVNSSGIAAAGTSSDPVTLDSTPPVVSISGTVTSKSGAKPLQGVYIYVAAVDGSYSRGYDSTDKDGKYTVEGLPEGKYTVCFDAREATGGSSATGYLSQCADGKDWDADSDPSADAKQYSVTSAGGVTADASLPAGSAIKGTVMSGSIKVSDAEVTVYDGSDYVTSAESGADGTYAAVGLRTGKAYTVCVDGTEATGGDAKAGFFSECYDNQAWDPDSEPSETAKTLSPPAAGSVTANFDLAKAGGIAGIISGEGGVTVSYGDVTLLDHSGNYVRDVQTDENGIYHLNGLPNGSYTVCAKVDNGDEDLPQGGLSSRCYTDVPWNPYGDGAVEGATAVPVTTNNLTAGTNVVLPRGGAISGSVHSSNGSTTPVESYVQVFDGEGATVEYGSTDGDGNYTIAGLRPGTDAYRVCFQPYNDGTDSYVAQCYSATPWNGDAVPEAATTVSVTKGQVRGKIDASLAPAATISGHISSDDEFNAEAFVYVIDDSTGDIAYVGYPDYDDDGVTGDYRVAGIANGSYHVCFSPTDERYASQCYNDVPWDVTADSLPGDVIEVARAEPFEGIDATLHPADN